jgi:flagellar basal-body rod protein FlgC
MNKFKILLAGFILSAGALAATTPGGLENALDISTSGIIAETTRMQVIAENVANIDTVRTEQGTPYRKKTVVVRPVEYFSPTSIQRNVLNGVRVTDIIEEKFVSSNKVYDPNHPEADKDGYVYYPNIDLTKELVEMTESSGAFEANLTVYNTTKAMMQSSLEIGK